MFLMSQVSDAASCVPEEVKSVVLSQRRLLERGVHVKEEQYQDLLLIMELLTNLLSKEFIDFSDTGNMCEALVWPPWEAPFTQ